MPDWENVGLRPARMVLPAKGVDMSRWAVLACDQYTSQEDYWRQVEEDVQESASTYWQMIPECYLEGALDERVERACGMMEALLAKETLREWPEGAMLVKRRWPDGSARHGLLLAVDLEAYDYKGGSRSLIRPSEGTIVARIPPRLKLRSQAALEYPHILMLVDDPQQTVIESLWAREGDFEEVYNFTLGWSGGPIEGRFVPAEALQAACAALEALKERSAAAYGEPFLMAVGDGNHSLATAKAHWEQVKQSLPQGEWRDHPARYALAELVNVYDEGIAFEPIPRVLFDVPADGAERIAALQAEREGDFLLPLACLQAALDAYLAEEPGVTIDYIHGEENARRIAEEAPGRLLFAPDVIEKEQLFAYIAKDGALPRKAFSMGEADQKRFYLEGRRIR